VNTLVLPATARHASLDFLDFAKRFYAFQKNERIFGPRTARQKKSRDNVRHRLRGFRPQKWANIVRADTNPDNRERNRLYLTMDNGQVLRADRVVRKGTNPHLYSLVTSFLDKAEKSSSS